MYKYTALQYSLRTELGGCNILVEHAPYLPNTSALGTEFCANVVCPCCALALAMSWLRHWSTSGQRAWRKFLTLGIYSFLTDHLERVLSLVSWSWKAMWALSELRKLQNFSLQWPYHFIFASSGPDVICNPVQICAPALRVVCTKYYALQLNAITCRQSR